MAFCKKCGQQIPDNANACPFCGTMVSEQAPQQAAPQQPYQQQPYQQGYAAPQQGYAAPQGYPQPVVSGDADVQQSRGIAWLSYLGLLFLIPMFVRKNSDYTRFHVKQGVTAFACELAYGIFFGIFMAIIDAIARPAYNLALPYYLQPTHSTVYWIFYWLLYTVFIFFTVIEIIGIVNAATGKKKELFLIGKIPWIATLLDKTVYK